MEFFLTYILPVIVVMVLSALIGFGLNYLGEKMKIERNPKIDDVSRLLPGVNCGGCGCAGCDAFACKIVEEGADINNCRPASVEAKQEIAKVLGRTLQEQKQLVAVVHCIGGNKCANKFSYQGYGDCQSAETIAGGNKACPSGCMGLGSCNEYCTYNAVSVDKDKGFAIVDSAKCTSCGACISACPKKIISRIPVDAKVYVGCSNTQIGKEVRSVCERGCIACKLCEKKCPHEAIKVQNNLAVIDYDKCTGCGICVGVCPSKCILNYTHGKINTIDATKPVTQSQDSAQTSDQQV